MLDFFRAVPKRRKVKINRAKGVIFYNPSFVKKCLFYAGCYLLVLSFGYLLYLYWPLSKAVLSFNIKPNNAINVPVYEEKIKEEVQENDDFYIHIPRIGASAKVIENVDPYHKEDYLKVLENNDVALASTSSKPGLGKGKSSYVFAHSTEQGLSIVRNNAIFYLLGELEKEDVILINYQGKILKYSVFDQKIIRADEIKYLDYSEEDKEVLILQTCWPIGTDWKRLLVFAQRI